MGLVLEIWGSAELAILEGAVSIPALEFKRVYLSLIRSHPHPPIPSAIHYLLQPNRVMLPTCTIHLSQNSYTPPSTKPLCKWGGSFQGWKR